MHPALRKSCLLRIPRKSLINQLLSDKCTDKVDNIELPPEPTNCCMSGCANCVWIEYAETVAKLLEGNSEKAREIVLSKIKDPNLKSFLAMELKYLLKDDKKKKT